MNRESFGVDSDSSELMVRADAHPDFFLPINDILTKYFITS